MRIANSRQGKLPLKIPSKFMMIRQFFGCFSCVKAGILSRDRYTVYFVLIDEG